MLINGWHVRDIHDGDEVPPECYGPSGLDPVRLLAWLVPALSPIEAAEIAPGLLDRSVCGGHAGGPCAGAAAARRVR